MQYKVELLFIDKENESKNVSYCAFVEAQDKDMAIAIAKKKQLTERPDLVTNIRWAWSVSETSEKYPLQDDMNS